MISAAIFPPQSSSKSTPTPFPMIANLSSKESPPIQPQKPTNSRRCPTISTNRLLCSKLEPTTTFSLKTSWLAHKNWSPTKTLRKSSRPSWTKPTKIRITRSRTFIYSFSAQTWPLTWAKSMKSSSQSSNFWETLWSTAATTSKSGFLWAKCTSVFKGVANNVSKESIASAKELAR